MIKQSLSILLFSTQIAEAAENSHAASHAVPWASVGVQAFNLMVLFLALFLALRKSIQAHFANRAREFSQLVDKAEAAKRQAERGHREIKDRLTQLESTAEQSLLKAEAEAEQLKNKMIHDAKLLSSKLEAEAKQTIALEVDKAKGELRHELLARALAESRDNLQKNLGSNEQKKLQNEFVEKIQVVGG